MKFFDTDQFKALEKEWYDKLKANKFDDLEDSRGRLKQDDQRTIGFENREAIDAFFSELGEFLATHRVSRDDRRVLMRYCQGKWQTQIAEATGFSYSKVKKIISKYKKLILAE